MKFMSKAAAALAAVALAGGMALNAFAAPGDGFTPGPDATMTPIDNFRTPTPYPSVITPEPTGTETPVPTTTMVTPTPYETVMPQPTGQVPLGTLTITISDDCRTATATAAGWGDLTAGLYVNYGGNGTIPEGTAESAYHLVDGAATATVTADEDYPTQDLRVYASVSGMYTDADGDQSYIEYHEEWFTPQCAAAAGGVTATVPPTVQFAAPSCTLTEDSVVPLSVAITNNAEGVIEGDFDLRDYTTDEYVPVVDYQWISLEPGQTGHFSIEVPRGFYGQIVYTLGANASSGHTITQAVNVEQCVQDQKAVVVAQEADCGHATFTVLNPDDAFDEGATYAWELTDAAGVVTKGTSDIADGATVEISQAVAAGMATLVVTNPDGSTSTGTFEATSCAAASPTLPHTGGVR